MNSLPGGINSFNEWEKKVMKTFRYIVQSPEGIHARPATILSQEIRKYKSKIMLEHDGVRVNASDIISLFKLRANQGSNIIFTIEGEDEVEATEKLKQFCQDNL